MKYGTFGDLALDSFFVFYGQPHVLCRKVNARQAVTVPVNGREPERMIPVSHSLMFIRSRKTPKK